MGCYDALRHRAPSSSGLGHHPLKVAARVRIPLGLRQRTPGQRPGVLLFPAKAAASSVRTPNERGRSGAALALQRTAGNAATTMAIQRFSMDGWDDMGIFSGGGQDQAENTGAGRGMGPASAGTQAGGWDGDQGGVAGGNAGYLAGMGHQVSGQMTRTVNDGRGPDAPSGAQARCPPKATSTVARRRRTPTRACSRTPTGRRVVSSSLIGPADRADGRFLRSSRTPGARTAPSTLRPAMRWASRREVVHMGGSDRRAWTRAAVGAAAVALASTVPFTGVHAAPRPYGDASVLATLPPDPGFPEGIAVQGDRVYVAGAATFGTTPQGPSAVTVLDLNTGAQLGVIPTAGEELGEHANSSIAFDGDGRLYVLNTQLGVYRLDLAKGTQAAYASPFPDLKPCPPIPVDGGPCSPTVSDAPPIPNDLAFDKAGNAYVTDSMQATIWKIAPGGGAPQVWFQDQRFASPYMGINGLRLDPKGGRMFVTVTIDMAGGAHLYSLPVVAKPSAVDLRPVFTFKAPEELPDGVAFGQAGLLYVALATPGGGSGVMILDVAGPRGREVGRLTNDGDPSGPYDSPANIAFDERGSILLSNHAFATGAVDRSRFNVLDVYVGDHGAPLFKPTLP
jgi:sugar lactone lactonase YvrE